MLISSAAVSGWAFRSAISCLIVTLATAGAVANIPNASVRVPTTLPHQSLNFAYWSERDGYESRLVLSNAKGVELFVRPTVYDVSGEALEVEAIRVIPGRPVSVRIGDLIKGTRASVGVFESGSLKLDFEAPDSGYLGAQVTIRRDESSLSFDVPAEMPMSFMSSRLEGIWRRAPDSETRIVLANTSSLEQSGTVTLTGQRSRGTFDWDFGLKPHETRVVEISTAEVAAVSSMAGEIGGIRIVHSGDPGSVIAFGAIAAPSRGFSSSIRFDDPAGAVTQKFAAAHLMVGQPDLPGLPPAAMFASLVALRNTAESPITVAPRVSFTANGVSRNVALTPRALLGGELQELILNEELRAIGVRGPLRDVGLSLDASGERGALLTRILCVDSSGTHVFEPPVKDTGSWMNRSGIYPINLSGDERSVVHVKNTSSEIALFTVHMDFDGGSYALEVQSLEPFQERAFDIRALRDLESPDCTGRLIPKEMMTGRVSWSEFSRKACIGRVEQYSPSKGVSSSFSCGDPCRCGPNAANHWMTPSSGAGKVGDVSFMSFFMTTQDFDCYGSTEMGPFDITDAFTTWTSSNPAIAKVGPFVSGSGRKITCMGLGQATVTANHTYFGYDGPDGNGDCFPVDESFGGSCPMAVVDISINLQGAPINGTPPVIVGQKIALSAVYVTNGATPTITNEKWTIPGNRVSGYVVVAPSSDLDPNTTGTVAALPAAPIGRTVDFHWVDGASTARQVTYSAKVNGKTMTATASFAVKRPTATVQTARGNTELGTTLGSYRLSNGSFTVGGFTIAATSVVTPAGFTGTYKFVQIWSPNRIFYLTAGGTSVLSGTGLDGTFPYPTEDRGGGRFGATDVPNNEIVMLFNREVVSDNFTMWFMFQPSTPGAIWVPLYKVSWKWKAEAHRVNPLLLDFVLDSSPAPGPSDTGTAVLTTEFPVWTTNAGALLPH